MATTPGMSYTNSVQSDLDTLSVASHLAAEHIKRGLSVTNLSSENNLPAFQLNHQAESERSVNNHCCL